MKTRLLLIAVTMIPCFLFGQGEIKKQIPTQTSVSSYQGQPNQRSVQTQNTYQPKQTYQSTTQYNQPQPQQQQYQMVRQDNTQLQNGYHNDIKYQALNNNALTSKTSLNRVEKESGLSTLNKTEYYDKITTLKSLKPSSINLRLVKPGEVRPNNIPICSLTDSSAAHHTEDFIYDKSPIKKDYLPQSPSHCPEMVYKLTPTLRLRYVCGDICGNRDLFGYGVHVAAFKNYDYCIAVSKWLRKKYKAITYILEDQSGYTHYHLVFGRWRNYRSAEIFEGKVRKDAPNAFVFKWMMEAIQLVDNSIIFYPE